MQRRVGGGPFMAHTSEAAATTQSRKFTAARESPLQIATSGHFPANRASSCDESGGLEVPSSNLGAPILNELLQLAFWVQAASLNRLTRCPNRGQTGLSWDRATWISHFLVVCCWRSPHKEGRMRRFLLVVVLVLALAAVALAGGAGAAGPQPLPDAACNQGTETAHAEGAGGGESIAHLHDFDSDGVWACYHRNPTAPPPPGPE
jgi:hypothetical protein